MPPANTIRIVSTPIPSLKIPQCLTRFRTSKLPGGHRWRQKAYQGVERFDEKLCRLIFFRKYIESLILIAFPSLCCLISFILSSEFQSPAVSGTSCKLHLSPHFVVFEFSRFIFVGVITGPRAEARRIYFLCSVYSLLDSSEESKSSVFTSVSLLCNCSIPPSNIIPLSLRLARHPLKLSHPFFEHLLTLRSQCLSRTNHNRVANCLCWDLHQMSSNSSSRLGRGHQNAVSSSFINPTS